MTFKCTCSKRENYSGFTHAWWCATRNPDEDETKAGTDQPLLDTIERIDTLHREFSITRPERQYTQQISNFDELVIAARLLCDNVQTVGTHHRIDGKYLEVLRKALDGL